MHYCIALLLLAAFAPGSEEVPYVSGFQPRDHVLFVADTDATAAAIPRLFNRSTLPAGVTVNKLARGDVQAVPESFRGDYFAGWVAKDAPAYQDKPEAFTLRSTSIKVEHRDGPALIDLVRMQHVQDAGEDLLLIVASQPVNLMFQTLLLRRVGPREVIGYHLFDANPGKQPAQVLLYRVSN